MCDRQTGIGADGLMIYAFDGDRACMQLLNADGSSSEVSGNGIRCLAALMVRERPGLINGNHRHARRAQGARSHRPRW